MKLLLAAVLYHLVVMPTSAPSGMKTSDNKDLFKPFDVAEETFDTEEACMVLQRQQSRLTSRCTASLRTLRLTFSARTSSIFHGLTTTDRLP
jgi:hypothetical protein